MLQQLTIVLAYCAVNYLPPTAQQFLALRCNGRQTLVEFGSAHARQMLLKAGDRRRDKSNTDQLQNQHYHYTTVMRWLLSPTSNTSW